MSGLVASSVPPTRAGTAVKGPFSGYPATMALAPTRAGPVKWSEAARRPGT